jgi:hypothetical protein
MKILVDDLVIGEPMSYITHEHTTAFSVPISAQSLNVLVMMVVNSNERDALDLARRFLKLLQSNTVLEEQVEGLKKTLAGLLEPCAN